LEVAIYEAVRLDFDLAYAAKLALLQLAICGLLIWMSSGVQSAAAAVRRPAVWQGQERWAGAQRFVIAGLAVAFILPLTATINDGLSTDFLAIWRQPVFLQALATSLAIATLSAGFTLALAWALAVARVSLLAPSRLDGRGGAALLARGLAFAGSLYLAVPALVLGLGLFLLFRLLGANYTLVGPVAVLLANMLLALPFALAILLPALGNAVSRYDRLAASLGLKGWARFRLLEGPMLRADLTFVGALSFCLSFGDLGVIALFGNQDFVTLPWLLYQKFGSYRTGEAAAIALVMLALTLIAFVIVPKLMGGKRDA
jgi:thiamine transport system permease protein